MARVISSRLLGAVPLLLAASFLCFLLSHWAPGSFLDQLSFHPGVPASVVEELAERYGLDRPWYQQYVSWLIGVARGDLGPSLSYQRPVSALLSEAVSRTLILALVAQAGGLLMGLALGLWSVQRLHGAWDGFVSAGALALASVHPVVLAILGLAFVASTGVLPIGGGGTFDASVSPSSLARAVDYFRHLLLPAGILTLFVLPGFFLQARGAFAELGPSPFVRGARARGLTERAIIWRHVLPAGLVPVLSFAGASIGRLLGGAFLVEVIVGWPGMGHVAITALRDRDPFLLLGVLVASGGVLLFGNLLVDLSLAAADPRIRLEGGEA